MQAVRICDMPLRDVGPVDDEVMAKILEDMKKGPTKKQIESYERACKQMSNPNITFDVDWD